MKKIVLILTILLIGILLSNFSFAGDNGRKGLYKGCDTKLYGVVEEVPAEGTIGIWVIDGREVQVTERTFMDMKHGAITKGSYVEVKGNANGKILDANLIEAKRNWLGNNRQTRAKMYGVIEEIPAQDPNGTWLVNGRQVIVTQATRISEKYGPAAIGSYVEVEGNFTGTDFTAYDIEVKDGNHTRMKPNRNQNYTAQ